MQNSYAANDCLVMRCRRGVLVSAVMDSRREENSRIVSPLIPRPGPGRGPGRPVRRRAGCATAIGLGGWSRGGIRRAGRRQAGRGSAATVERQPYDLLFFFSSTVFYLTQPALAPFITERAGSLRMLCSPRLSTTDAEGLLYGYEARDNAELASALRDELQQMLASPLRETAHLLAALVAAGRLDMRLARVTASVSLANKRMFHEQGRSVHRRQG